MLMIEVFTDGMRFHSQTVASDNTLSELSFTIIGRL